MTQGSELMHLLADWRHLTRCEGQAILMDDWRNLADHQSRKARLQEEITRVLASAHTMSDDRSQFSGADRAEIAPAVQELVALETQNLDLLAQSRRNRQPEFQRLAQTVRNLQQMRRAYGPSRGPHWHSYS
jgi:hypothetical protein